MRRAWMSMAAAAAIAGCASEDGEERVPASVAERLPQPGQLQELCPVIDAPARHYEQTARRARRQAELLIREVRRRPDAEVVLTFEDAHTGEPLTERLTIRELAEDHLRQPGVEGPRCARSVMARLKAATEGRPPPQPPPRDEPVYLLDDIVAALRLRKHGGIYRSRHCREIQVILSGTEEVEIARDEPIRGVVVVADAAGIVGAELFRPTRACRREMVAGLNRVAAGPGR